MISKVLWVLLVWILCISTFGLWICSIVLLSSVFACLGCAVMLYAGQELHICTRTTPVGYKGHIISACAGIPKIVQRVKHPPKLNKYDKRLTGSTKIDEPLQEIIKYILRDYILSWYSEVSTDEEFIICIKELFKKVINNVADCTKEVPWVSFVTRHLVEDFASHLRLYRQTERAFKKAQKEESEKQKNIQSIFFDFELNMEKILCRDMICTSEVHEKKYLQFISDLLLYLILPCEDFNNKIMRYFLRELLACTVLHPTICMFSDPDYINQSLISMCKDYPVTSKAFLTVIRRTDSFEELSAVKEIAKHELKVQKSKDTRDKDEMKQHTKSITFVQDVANQRYHHLLNCDKSDTDSFELFLDIDLNTLLEPESESKLISLPFDIALNNNVGLHYFTEFMTSIGAQGYVFFYHNIEGFRTSVEMILADKEQMATAEDEHIEKLREFAMHIFESYLGESAVARVNLDELLLKKLYSRIKTEKLSESCFDEVQAKVYEIMQDEFYSTGFVSSPYYVKLLAELDLLQDMESRDDESLTSSKSGEEEKFDCHSSVSTNHGVIITELLSSQVPNSEFCFLETSLSELEDNQGIGILAAEVYSTGITHHAGKTFAVYAVAVSHQKLQGTEEKWFVVRRYSEFYDFHEMVTEKFPVLSSFNFPTKKTFNNLSRHLMEKRRHMLNEYIQSLLSLNILSSCDGLLIMLYNFLEPRVCEQGKKSFVRTVETLVNPIKTSVKTFGSIVKLVPDTLFELKDGLVKVLSKNPDTDDLRSPCSDTDKVSAGLDLEADNIPLRIMLLLIDEVFDLKNKDLWFRRRIMILLRQIIKTTQGDSINRKITDHVKGMTSASQVAEWLKLFSQMFWPSGILAQSAEERDYNTKMRTRVAAKTLLLCCVPDELKHIIGNETSLKGSMMIFNMFQHSVLNRRLGYVLLENFLMALFPKSNLQDVFRRLHSESSRIMSPFTTLEDHFGEDKKKPHFVQEKTSAETNNSVSSSEPNTSLKSKSSSKSPKHEKCTEKVSKKNKLSFQCVSKQESEASIPKILKKRKKSLETAIFYADCANSDLTEDAVYLPLSNNNR